MKQRRRGWPGALGLGLLLLAACWSPVAAAKGESTAKKGRATAAARPTPRPAKVRSTTAKPKPTAKPAASAAATAPAKTPDAPGAAGRNEAAPAGVTKATEAPSAQTVVSTEENDSGVKTFTFGAEEIEGRLKSPQILYFLRRVRAEFDPQPLGHRSFLLELSDTRRNPALR